MRGTDRILSLVAFAVVATGCWIEEPSPPPPFDCAAIDRADERFPERCADAGVEEDAGP